MRPGALHVHARLGEELRASVTAHAVLLTTPGVATPRRESVLLDAYSRRRHRHRYVDVFPFSSSRFFFFFSLLSSFWSCVLAASFSLGRFGSKVK